MEKFARFIVRTRNLLFMLLLLFAIAGVHLAGGVVVNTDMTELLPDDSQVRSGILIMEDEFGDNNTANLQVMFEGLEDNDERQEIYEQLNEIENVALVVFDAESEAHVLEEFTLYTIVLEQGMTRDDERVLVRAIQEAFYEFDIDLSGQIAGVYIELNMMLITVPTVIILTMILFFMCRSWFEPIIFFINIGIALLINMGTNVIFDSISDITQMIAGLLQVVLSMDYSIIFLNRYRQEKEKMPVGGNRKIAMKNAIKNSFSTISGISFTTIVGMLMLAFMTFAIGADIGFVIAKGVFASLVCVFGVMPSLILRCEKLIEKTEKPVLKLNMSGVGRLGHKARYVVGVFFVLLFAGAFFLQNQIVITYAEVDYDPVHQVFDLDNRFIILYDNADEANMADFVSAFEEVDDVISIMAYSNMLGMGLSEEELVGMLEQEMEMDPEMAPMFVNLVFMNYFEVDPPEVTINDFSAFLQWQLPQVPMFADVMSPEDLQALNYASWQVDHYTFHYVPQNAEYFAGLWQMDPELVTQLLYVFGLFQQQAAAEQAALQAQNPYGQYGYPADGEESDENGEDEVDDGEEVGQTMTLRSFINYLVDDMAEIELFTPFFTEEVLEELEEIDSQLSEGAELFVAENYSRLIITTTVPFETDETFIFMDHMMAQLEYYLEGDFYVVGTSALPHEMRQTFPDEHRLITSLTMIAFFVVAAISFRSIAVSAILAIVIQASVFVTMGVTYFQDGGIMFIPLIIAQVLLKSLVIDYGILYTANYIEARKEHGVKDAMIAALNNSIHIILTSGLIVVLVTFVVGLLFRDVNAAIADILLLIAQGSFVGIMISVFILPSLVAIFDRFVIKAKAKVH